jgi:hypothetical protein
MTMYLSNTDLHPTGSETAEFIDLPPMSEQAGAAGASIGRPDGNTMRLDVQTRLNIARWAREYISGLVENHHGGPEDVRSIIHDLHDRRAIAGPEGSL